jgi:hypothetical protein
MFFLISWAVITALTIFFFILIVVDCYQKLLKYYKNIGTKIPITKSSIGAKLSTLIKCVFISICPILHFLYLASFIIAYEEICQKVVVSYICSHKKDKVNDY